MMTIDDAFAAASKLLDQRGQLLNAHLLKAVEGNKDHFREVRARLIQEGLAEDRAGVGLVRIEIEMDTADQSPAVATEEIRFATVESISQFNPLEFATVEDDWYLMTKGMVRGPIRLNALREMIRRCEIRSSDVVRKGSDGLWQQPEEFSELKAAIAQGIPKPAANQRHDRSSFVPNSTKSGAAGTKVPAEGVSAAIDGVPSPNRFVPPEKTWSTANEKPPGFLAKTWKMGADHAGGSRRLAVVLCVVIVAVGFIYWWRLLPSSAAIVNEFTTCRDSLSLLRQHRAGRSEYAPVVQKFRPRVEYLVGRLKPRANEHYPIDHALYLAGSDGLLPWLDNPTDSFVAENEFDKQILRVRQLLSGAPSHKGQKH